MSISDLHVAQVLNPFLLVYLVGIVLSCVFWKRHRAVSVLSLIAFLLLLGSQTAGIATQLWEMRARSEGSSSADIGRVLGTVGIFRVVVGTVAWALLLTALFGWRSAPKRHEDAVNTG